MVVQATAGHKKPELTISLLTCQVQYNTSLFFGTHLTCHTASVPNATRYCEQKHACGSVELCDGSQAASLTVLALWHRLAAQSTALCDVAAQQLLAGTAYGLCHQQLTGRCEHETRLQLASQ